MSDTDSIFVIVTCGPEDADRAHFALQLALVSASSGVETHVFLTLRASHWACAANLGSAGAEAIYTTLESLAALGVSISACSTCLERHCMVEPEAAGTLRAGIRPAGMMGAIQRTLQTKKTLTF